MKKANALLITLLAHTISSYGMNSAKADELMSVQQSLRTEESLARRQTQLDICALQEKLHAIASFQKRIQVVSERRAQMALQRQLQHGRPLTWNRLNYLPEPIVQLNPQTDLLNLLVRAHLHQS